MEQMVRGELADLLGVKAQPCFARIWRHPSSMPQYHVGHDARVQRIENALRRFSTLTLAGSAYHGVGISDCVRTGAKPETDGYWAARNLAVIKAGVRSAREGRTVEVTEVMASGE